VIQFGLGCQTAVTRLTSRPGAGHGRDDAGCGNDFADIVVLLIKDEHITGLVNRQPDGQVELRGGCRSAIAAEWRMGPLYHAGGVTEPQWLWHGLLALRLVTLNG